MESGHPKEEALTHYLLQEETYLTFLKQEEAYLTYPSKRKEESPLV